MFGESTQADRRGEAVSRATGSMAYPYRSQFGDTTLTKVFVGGLAWETPAEEMRKYFEQFGEILEAVIINDKDTGNSKGYGFVTFRDPESAKKACAEPNPMIDGRRANCNIAALGRPRPSPPRGRNQGGNPYQVGVRPAAASPRSSYTSRGIPTQSTAPPPSLQPPPPVFYSPYGFQPYSPDYAFHHQVSFFISLFNNQAPYYPYHPVYGATASPYYFSYSPLPRGTYGAAPPAAQLRPPAPSYLYYPHPTPLAAEPSAVPALSAVSPFQPPPPPTLQRLFPPPTDYQQKNPQSSSPEQQTEVPTSASSSKGLTS